MRTLLDGIIDSYGAPQVISEQHDANAINWVGGVTDPGEMIGCGRYQQLRRLHGEADAAYQTRLLMLLPTLPADDRAKIEKTMKAAALRRAGLDTSTGRVAVMVAGRAPWHGLGVNVAEAVNSVDAIRLAGLNWTVDKVPMKAHSPEGWEVDVPDAFAIVRTDTHAPLGTVGTRYKPLQNADGFDFLDSLLGEFGAKYETAGAVYGGRRVWMLVNLPRQSFSVARGDSVDAYALFTNAHDGSGAGECFGTSERPVCGNTLRVAQQKGKGHGVKLRHTGNIRGKLDEARTALGLTVQGFERFSQEAEVLARTPCEDFKGYANGVLDAVLDVTEAEAVKGICALSAALNMTEAEEKRKLKAIERRASLLSDIIDRYESERCGVGGIRGTAWAALNAVTEHADHSSLYRYVGSENARQSRRFESVIDGPADEMKQVAYANAMALAN